MRYVASGIGVLATAVLMAVTARINWLFQYSQGHSPNEAQMLGLGSVVIDIFKAVLPCLIAWFWVQRKVVLVLVGSGSWILCFMISLLSALGFFASNRVAVTGGRDTTNLNYHSVR